MKTSLGFTFLELLIVISLISFLSITGIAAFVGYTRVQTLNSGTQDVYTLLQRAKSKSLTQVKSTGPGSCSAAGVLHGYRVSIISQNDFELVARCGGLTEALATSRPVDIINIKQLPAGIRFNLLLTTDSWFLFTVLNGGVINSSTTSSGDIVITDGGSSKTITVDSSGTISVN